MINKVLACFRFYGIMVIGNSVIVDLRKKSAHYALGFLLTICGCDVIDPQDHGPIDTQYLWQAWETTGWHGDLRDFPAGTVIVERYHNDSTAFENTGTGPEYHIPRYCRLYHCNPDNPDTCVWYHDNYFHIESDTVLNFSIPTINDKRTILRLTDSNFTYLDRSMRAHFIPSKRVLADTNGGDLTIHSSGE